MKTLKEIIKNYKDRKCKTIFGKIIQIIIFNNLARLGFFAILTIISGLAIDFFNVSALIWFLLFYFGIGYMFLFGVISLIFAWIINPLKK